jgi:hypothetical protein
MNDNEKILSDSLKNEVDEIKFDNRSRTFVELKQQRTISTTTKTGFTTHFSIGDGTNHRRRRISNRHESHVL